MGNGRNQRFLRMKPNTFSVEGDGRGRNYAGALCRVLCTGGDHCSQHCSSWEKANGHHCWHCSLHPGQLNILGRRQREREAPLPSQDNRTS